MITKTELDWLVFLALAVNFGASVRFWMLNRRLRRLNEVWFQLCLGGWRMRSEPHRLRQITETALARHRAERGR
jgi:hypothetical protein